MHTPEEQLALMRHREAAELRQRTRKVLGKISAGLSGKQLVGVIRDILYGLGVDSETRLEHLLMLTASAPSNVFWPVFLDAWSCCDNTWSSQRQLLKVLRVHHRSDPGLSYLNAATRRWIHNLPEKLPVYRGCSRHRIGGVSWSTRPGVARGFALGHRGIAVPDAVLVRANVRRDAIFAGFLERDESEVVIDPAGLADIEQHSLTACEARQ